VDFDVRMLRATLDHNERQRAADGQKIRAALAWDRLQGSGSGILGRTSRPARLTCGIHRRWVAKLLHDGRRELTGFDPAVLQRPLRGVTDTVNSGRRPYRLAKGRLRGSV